MKIIGTVFIFVHNPFAALQYSLHEATCAKQAKFSMPVAHWLCYDIFIPYADVQLFVIEAVRVGRFWRYNLQKRFLAHLSIYSCLNHWSKGAQPARLLTSRFMVEVMTTLNKYNNGINRFPASTRYIEWKGGAKCINRSPAPSPPYCTGRLYDCMCTIFHLIRK